ncbi:MAG: trypsin-like serine protease, partial [Myxococcota bacterium]
MKILCLAAGLLGIACGPPPAGPPANSPAVQRSALQDGVDVESLTWLSDSVRASLVRIEELDGTPRCTASLIDERALLTAAHCFALPGSADPLEVAVEVASLRMRSTVANIPLAHVVRHPSLDVAVAFLAVPVEPALAASMEVNYDPGAIAVGQEIWVMGAGRGTPDEVTVSAGRFAIDQLASNELVVSPVEDARLCAGDSGGPLLLPTGTSPRIVGVHVRGYPDCSPPNYAVRADILEPWLTESFAELPAPLAPCEPAADQTFCHEGVARSCEEGYWRDYPCDSVYYACVADDEGAATCAPIPCGDISPSGRCDDGIARVCMGGTLATFDCISAGLGCDFLVEEARVGCSACTACDGTCVDHSSDSFHCGACGVQCAPSGRG